MRDRANRSSRSAARSGVCVQVAREFGFRGSGARLIGLIGVTALTLLALFASSADAAQTRPFKEVFGSVAQPSFPYPTVVATDLSNGDVLVGDYSTQSISRFHSDGTAAPFSALGTNVIDGAETGGEPCAIEPASCDKTPQNELEIDAARDTGIAVDSSGGITDGDIYVTQRGAFNSANKVVDIFASSGRYLGQLTGSRSEEFQQGPEGVAIDSEGALYISVGAEILKYIPSSNPPIDTDSDSTFDLHSTRNFGNLAIGSGPTAGSLFAIEVGDGQTNGERPHPVKFDRETGERKYTLAQGVGSFLGVDPTSGRVIVQSLDKNEALEFDAAGESSAVMVGRLREKGGNDSGFAANESGEIYTAALTDVNVYGKPITVPTTVVGEPINVTGTKATLTGTVNAENLDVTECLFEYGETVSYGLSAPCEGMIPSDSNPHPVHLDVAGLEPDGHTYHYRIVARDVNGVEESADQTFATAATVVTAPASAVERESATLNGTLRPEGDPYSECVFEYGVVGGVGFEDAVPCEPAAGTISPDFSPHAVSAALTNLEGNNVTYHFRVKASGSRGIIYGTTLTFTTNGEPGIGGIRAYNADQDSATLESTVDPHGYQTSYQVEWGPTAAYGRIAERGSIEVGAGPTKVTAPVSGLTAGTAFHYRVVATNDAGTTTSSDRVVETLNACGLPQGRCFELVSPPDAGPIATPGRVSDFIFAEMDFQAGTQSGALAYASEGGYPGATRGAEVLYKALRMPSGWSSSQLSPPVTDLDETKRPQSESSRTLGLSPNLACGVVESNQPLTNDPATKLVVESGGTNLYRYEPDGSYTAITTTPPENPEAESEGAATSYRLAGASSDCSRVFFSSVYRYPGTGAIGKRPLYEWDKGTLRFVGTVPGPSGEVPVEAEPGGGLPDPVNFRDDLNAVSGDGSRVFFSAEKPENPGEVLPGEVGTTGVFVREAGSSTRDLSLSETEVPDEGATYQYATPDGSRVFFTANAGLTEESSAGGTDLYEYDLEKSPSQHPLTDLSVNTVEAVAGVVGMLGAADDGAHVYFAARGQLVAGQGLSGAENQSEKTYSLYAIAAGQVNFVATVDASSQGLLTSNAVPLTSRVSADGRYLLFESVRPITSYQNMGAPEAYLYDAVASSEAITCISCRPDGQPSAATANPEYRLLTSVRKSNPAEPLGLPPSLVVTDNGPIVLFSSLDPLAPGATEGDTGLYEWAHGQVFLISSEPPEMQADRQKLGTERYVSSLGASADGLDLYLATPNSLTWEDGDERFSVYDARIGGGFPEPSPLPSPCNPSAEGSCQGPAGQIPPSQGAGTAAFTGPGNKKPHHKKKHHKKKHHKKKHHKKKHHKKKHHKKKHHKKKHHKKKHHKKKHHKKKHHRKVKAGRNDGNRRAGE